MPGRHASPDNSQFYRDFAAFGLRWLLGAVIVFGGAWFLTSQVFGGDGDSATTEVIVSDAAAPATTAAPFTTAAPSTTAAITQAPTTSRPALTTSAAPSTSVAPSTTAPAPTTSAAPTTTAAPSTTLGPELAPSELTVRVLNSTGRAGLAAAVTADLAAQGYIMRLQDNYNTPLATTTVFYVAGLDREAVTLAGLLPGETTTAPNPAAEPSADLLVVLGSSYP